MLYFIQRVISPPCHLIRDHSNPEIRKMPVLQMRKRRLREAKDKEGESELTLKPNMFLHLIQSLFKMW